MESITFEQMPAKLEELSKKLDRLLSLQALPKDEPDKLMNMDELREYVPGAPARQTVYQWVFNRKIPYEKHSKFLYFRKSSVDKWLLEGRPGKVSMK